MISNEKIEAAAQVIDSEIIPIIRAYCNEKGYSPVETPEEIANSPRWNRAKDLAKKVLEAAAWEK